jgi:hypothetical protein
MSGINNFKNVDEQLSTFLRTTTKLNCWVAITSTTTANPNLWLAEPATSFWITSLASPGVQHCTSVWRHRLDGSSPTTTSTFQYSVGALATSTSANLRAGAEADHRENVPNVRS